ncbi:MAG: hypothetical protein Q8L86_14435 [Vicinamibacterales bacterium]|nr:hypothetical protein [Vicinamibacterales bacterium]
MLQRVVFVVVWGVSLAVVGAVGVLIYFAQVQRSVPPTQGTNLPIARQQANPWARWTVTSSLSAHHVLLVHIETRYLDEAMGIAKQIADPIKFRYAEVVIYFHRPGRPDLLPPRKIVWTPTDDYVETNYEEEE